MREVVNYNSQLSLNKRVNLKYDPAHGQRAADPRAIDAHKPSRSFVCSCVCILASYKLRANRYLQWEYLLHLFRVPWWDNFIGGRRGCSGWKAAPGRDVGAMLSFWYIECSYKMQPVGNSPCQLVMDTVAHRDRARVRCWFYWQKSGSPERVNKVRK